MARKKNKSPKAPEVQTAEPERVKSWFSPSIAAVLLVVACVTIYFSVAGFDFINLDDDIYVYENIAVAKGLTAKAVAWAFTTFQASNWHPLTWLSHELDVSLFGAAAGGHHAVNLLFHIANLLLVFYLLNRITNDTLKSAFVAALFAVHPAHVESVAWVAERKDVLSTLFWLLASLAYVRYARDRSDIRAYWLSVVLFGLGLTAKPMLVTFPFALLLLDYWPLKGFEELKWPSLRPILVEKVPFFVLSIGSAVITVVAQRAGGAVQSLETFTVQERVVNAFISYAKYAAMFFYPADLGLWYPFDRSPSIGLIAGSLFTILVVSAAAVWQARKRPYLFVGWFWFLGTLVPVIGLVQVGRQAMADRYTYIPYVGLSIAVVWLLSEAADRFRIPETVRVSAAFVLLVALSIVCYQQVSYWKNSETIYLRTLQVTNDNYLVEANYCRFLERANRLDEAVKYCSMAVEDDPRGVDALNTLGTIQMRQGKLDDARQNFLRTLDANPDYSLAYANLSLLDSRQQNFESAVDYFDQAIAHDQGGFFDTGRRAEGYTSIGSAALMQKRYDIATRCFEKALAASPDNADVQRSLAISYRSQGRLDDAARILEAMIQKNPNAAEAYNTLGTIYADQNRKQEAVAQFQRALQINPNFSQARTNLQRVTQ
jgi:tetratricopeptide (TPR) repeat protein